MPKPRRLEKVRDIRLAPSADVSSLVEQMGRSGGFMAKNVAVAARLLKDMVADDKCTKFLSFPADLMATGLRGVLVEMVRLGMADVIVTTCGTLDHDIARTDGDYYHGDFGLDDSELHRSGYHRLGNVVIPVDAYGPAIERRMRPLLGRLYDAGVRSVTTESLCREIGNDLRSKGSLLHCAAEKRVPVFVPGMMDGAVGSQIWLFAETHRDFQVDLIGDERRLSDIVFESKRTGALVLGGGISKHHVIWWNQFKEGLDYACYVTTAVEYDGSLSGAQVREAVSWGKVKEKADQVTLYADATTVLPLLVEYALTATGGTRGP